MSKKTLSKRIARKKHLVKKKKQRKLRPWETSFRMLAASTGRTQEEFRRAVEKEQLEWDEEWNKKTDKEKLAFDAKMKEYFGDEYIVE